MAEKDCSLNSLYSQLDDERKCLICLDKELCYQKSRIRDCEDILMLLQNEVECKERQCREGDFYRSEMSKAVQCLQCENQKLSKIVVSANSELNSLLRLATSMAEKAAMSERCKCHP